MVYGWNQYLTVDYEVVIKASIAGDWIAWFGCFPFFLFTYKIFIFFKILIKLFENAYYCLQGEKGRIEGNNENEEFDRVYKKEEYWSKRKMGG